MEVYQKIIDMADQLQPQLVLQRRDFHKYAESGWLEMRTSSIIARKLTQMGYEVLVGEAVCDREARMGVPSEAVLEAQYARAVEQGADPEFAPYTKGGMTGVVGIVDLMSDTAAASPTWVDAVLNMLYFAGFLSVNLAVMNLLPIPALDGGRAVCVLLTTAWEGITKKKLDPKYEGYLHGAGMIALLALMAIITFKDIFTIFRG